MRGQAKQASECWGVWVGVCVRACAPVCWGFLVESFIRCWLAVCWVGVGVGVGGRAVAVEGLPPCS